MQRILTNSNTSQNNIKEWIKKEELLLFTLAFCTKWKMMRSAYALTICNMCTHGLQSYRVSNCNNCVCAMIARRARLHGSMELKLMFIMYLCTMVQLNSLARAVVVFFPFAFSIRCTEHYTQRSIHCHNVGKWLHTLACTRHTWIAD